MEKQHTNTRTTTSATDLYNSLIKAILCGRSTTDPPDVYVECEVHDVEEDYENS